MLSPAWMLLLLYAASGGPAWAQMAPVEANESPSPSEPADRSRTSRDTVGRTNPGLPMDEFALLERSATRESIIAEQTAQSQAALRQRVLLAYRLARQNQLGFVANPETRLDNTKAADLALLALRRSLGETRALSSELERARLDREALEAALGERMSTPPSQPYDSKGRFLRPVKGAVVGQPGLRRDGPGGTELRYEGVDVLARMDEPVLASAPGTVRLVKALPQGGFAVVTEHEHGWVSIVSGMRDVLVTPGQEVERGQPLGLAGRNLDGAAIVSLELWQNRRSVDPRKMIPGLRH